MKCDIHEEMLALYVEGDLSDSQFERVRSHLVVCVHCRAAVDELQDSQSILKSLGQDKAPETAHRIVRERVLNEIVSQASTSWALRLERMLFGIRWRYAVCGMALIFIAGAMLWEFRRVEQPATAIVSTLAERPPLPASVQGGTAPQFDYGEQRHQRARTPAQPTERRTAPLPKPVIENATVATDRDEPRQSMVKMLTDDPNVVIYWIVDQKDQKGGPNESSF